MRAKFKQLGKESVIYGLGGVASRFISFLLLPIYTRVFSPADYGVLDVITTMVALAGIVLTAGTETALSYHFYNTDDVRDRKKSITTTAVFLLAVNFFVMVAVWLLADKIVGLMFGSPEFAGYLRVAVLAIPFSSLVSLHLNVLRLTKKPWVYVSLSLAQFLCMVALNIYLVVILRVGIIGVFWSNVSVAILFSMVGSVVNRRYFGLVFSQTRLVQLLRYGLPLVVGGLSMWTINYVDRYFLLQFASLEQVGIYSVGLRIASVMVLVTQAFRTANAPFQFEMMNHASAPNMYSRTLVYYILGTSILAVPLSLFARPLLQIVTTEAYFQAYTVVALAVYSAIFYGLYQIVSVGLLVTKKTGFTGTAVAVGALANFVYLIVTVPYLGIVGAALATLLTHVTIVVLLYIGAQRAYPIPYQPGRIVGILALGWSVIIAGFVLQRYGFWLDSVIGFVLSLVFVGLIPLLSLLEPAEQEIMRDGLRRIAARAAGQ